ncbi:MAG: thiamine-monophosphate kinase [Puniceicoccaceae bacterium 5H]|nr:MAG: thiamine-monophosphate kinase [Puniceicoccaceae bacterium 5H]
MSATYPLFSEHKEETIAAWGEVQLLGYIREWLGDATPPAPHGMGDDTAVLPDDAGNVITTDSLVFGRHFTTALPPELAGEKLLKRNLSDIAAMGAKPTVAVLAGFFPANLRQDWLQRFTEGLGRCAVEWGTRIVGGDLAQINAGWSANLTLLGHAARPVLRTGAGIGDWIFVTGQLGGSIVSWHARFTPRLKEGQWLAQQPEIVSMIDLTDGIAKDLPALMTPDQQALVNRSDLPLRLEAKEQEAGGSGKHAWQHALTDGEDYELLFTWRGDATELRERWPFTGTDLTCIGRIEERPSPDAPLLLDPMDELPLLKASGYEHFR